MAAHYCWQPTTHIVQLICKEGFYKIHSDMNNTSDAAMRMKTLLNCLSFPDGVMELHRSQERRMATCGGCRARRQPDSSSQVREMEELRARTQQMEKTLKWWSDCTANWREKWTKVRIERNKAVEEVRETRREADRLGAERDRAREENEMLRSEVRELRSRGAVEDQEKSNVRNNNNCGDIR